MDKSFLKQTYFYIVSIISLFIILWAIIRLGEHVVNLIFPMGTGVVLPGDPIPDNNLRVQEIRGLFDTAIAVVVTLPIYYYHWRIARKSNQVN